MRKFRENDSSVEIEFLSHLVGKTEVFSPRSEQAPVQEVRPIELSWHQERRVQQHVDEEEGGIPCKQEEEKHDIGPRGVYSQADDSDYRFVEGRLILWARIVCVCSFTDNSGVPTREISFLCHCSHSRARSNSLVFNTNRANNAKKGPVVKTSLDWISLRPFAQRL